MKHRTSGHINNRLLPALLVCTSFIFFVFSGCQKEEADFTPSFGYEMINDNNVRFVNQSTGEYYFMSWDFGNGITETTTNKNQAYEVYYPQAGDYVVSLRIQNNSGESKATNQTITIANDDTSLEVSFTAEVDAGNPNYVNLKNTTQGQYDSFK